MIFETAPLTTVTIIFTIAISAMLIFAGSILLIINRISPDIVFVFFGVIFALIFGTFEAALFLSVPHQYVIESDKIIIDRYLFDVKIEFDDIAIVREADYSHWKGKNGWNCGVFGFAGKYYFEDYRRSQVYLTNWKYLVMIERKEDRPILISPDDPRAFVSAYRKTSGIK